MYQLLKHKTLTFFNLNKTTLSNVSSHYRAKATHTTHINPHNKPKKPRKKRTKGNRKVEVIMVSDTSHKQFKATVTKLKPQDLKTLALTNLNLGELYKLKQEQDCRGLHLNVVDKSAETFTYNNLAFDFPFLPLSLDHQSVISNTFEHVESIPNESSNLYNFNSDKTLFEEEICDKSNEISAIEADNILESKMMMKINREDTFKPSLDIEERVESAAEQRETELILESEELVESDAQLEKLLNSETLLKSEILFKPETMLKSKTLLQSKQILKPELPLNPEKISNSNLLLNPETQAMHLKIQPNLDVVNQNKTTINAAVDPGTATTSTDNTLQDSNKEINSKSSKENQDQNKKRKDRPYNLEYRKEVINRTLGSFIEVCVSLNSPHKGLAAIELHKYRSKSTKTQLYPPISDINVYNALLKGYSARGDFYKIERVLTLVKEDNLNFNVDTYVAILECLGRNIYHPNVLKEIRIYTKLAQSEGFTYDRIMNDGYFARDQREMVLNAMKLNNPKYLPKFEEPSVQYQNKLVDSLNHNNQLKVYKINLDSLGKTKKVSQLKTETLSYENPIETKKLSENFLKSVINEQLDIEKLGYVSVRSIAAKPKVSNEVLKFREAFDSQLLNWEVTATKAFDRDLLALSNKRGTMNMDVYFKAISRQDFVHIIVEEGKKLAQGSETYSPTVTQLYRDLGQKVYSRYKILIKLRSCALEKIIDIHGKFCCDKIQENLQLGAVPQELKKINSRQDWQWIEYLMKPDGAMISLNHQEWTPTVLVTIGKFLYNIIINDLKVDVNVVKQNSKHKNFMPAFYTIFRRQGWITMEEVKPHPVLSKLYRASVPENLTFPANEVPMKCPPIPWISTETGGYLILPCEFIRLPPNATTQKERLREAKKNSLYPMYDALNQLSTTPWKVNDRILDVILEVFNNGGSSRLDVPEHPSTLPPPPPLINETDKTERFKNLQLKLQYRRKKGEMYSLWCDCLYRLSLANHFRKTIFWLPHNMDFRGRVYPVPPHLNYQGSDLARSLLVFAESRPLGPHGLDWLKLHLINLTGLKKRDPVHERLIYANEILDTILDSADNPLTGKMWWAESDEPWQTLACCMEVANAVRSRNPEKYRTHFPIHQDGSCNGLQHYAALGRDSAGAYSVNLSPAEEPQDVYSAVASLVEKRRQTDAENGLEIAKILDGFVKRKVIKQTVMTTVYGVTRFGARLQIARQLKDIESFPKNSIWAASSYLTGTTFDALKTMFISTKEIQDWLTECARLISSVGGQNIEWVTPLGLPVVQPYTKYKRISQNKIYENYHMDKYEAPNVMKHKNAFPPNFIHSLDSTHMMLTSLYSERAGINFVSVHDCYWTHPSTVYIMNKICREQFVTLHSQPILEDLSVFLTERYIYGENAIQEVKNDNLEIKMKHMNRVLRKLPKTGKFNINEVLKSVYFFS